MIGLGWRPSVCALLLACTEPPAPAAPAAPAPKPVAKTAAAAPTDMPNPCATPGVQTIELEAGLITKTPWGLEITYAIDEDPKLGPGYMFLLNHGARRWQTRRDVRNWTTAIMWRGFCWRGGARPEKRASKLQLEIAPSCKDGVVAELADCSAVLGASR